MLYYIEIYLLVSFWMVVIVVVLQLLGKMFEAFFGMFRRERQWHDSRRPTSPPDLEVIEDDGTTGYEYIKPLMMFGGTLAAIGSLILIVKMFV